MYLYILKKEEQVSQNYKEVVSEISAQLAQMNKAIPATMAGFG